MPSMFDNAVSSIRMGVEDYGQQDGDRILSAVRNLYAGVLLLAKEALVRKAPNADPQEVIGAVFKPVPDEHGGVEYVAASGRTIDFDGIGKRFKDFGLTIDQKALSELNAIRNDIEHHYTDKPGASIRTAIAKAFPVIADLFRQIEESPVAHLGDVWEKMLEERALYDQELRAARASLATVAWHAAFMTDAKLKCIECGSELLEQIHADNASQNCIEFHCRNCGATPERDDVVEAAVEEAYGADQYINAKEGGGEGPIHDCPACSSHAYLEDEAICANCGETLDFESTCARCHSPISIQDYLDGMDGGLCGYCTHLSEKVMRE